MCRCRSVLGVVSGQLGTGAEVSYGVRTVRHQCQTRTVFRGGYTEGDGCWPKKSRRQADQKQALSVPDCTKNSHFELKSRNLSEEGAHSPLPRPLAPQVDRGHSLPTLTPRHLLAPRSSRLRRSTRLALDLVPRRFYSPSLLTHTF